MLVCVVDVSALLHNKQVEEETWRKVTRLVWFVVAARAIHGQHNRLFNG
jgi:hypothetical protein